MNSSLDTTTVFDGGTLYPDAGRPVAAIAVGGIILILILLVTLLGNITVIVAVASYRQLKEQQSNLFIVNLAAADLAVALCVTTWTVISYTSDMGVTAAKPWAFKQGLCYFQCAMNYCLIVVSMMTLGFISLDRFVHIVYPLRYIDIITVSKIRIMIIWTWIQGLAIGFTPVFMHWIHYDYHEVVCAVDWSTRQAVTFVIVAFVTCFVVPAAMMVFCYIFIMKEIRRSMKMVHLSESIHQRQSESNGQIEHSPTRLSIQSSLKSKSSSSSLTREISQELKFDSPNKQQLRAQTSANQHKKIIQSLLVVVLIFFVCMTPFCVTKLIKVLQGHVPGWVNTLATFVQLAASATNPLIYGVFRKEFRRAFKRQYDRIWYKLGVMSELDENTNSRASIFKTQSQINRSQSHAPPIPEEVEISDEQHEAKDEQQESNGH